MPITVTVARRFRGPARSGNGGYTAGRLAEHLRAATGSALSADQQPIQVRLHAPPPLDTPLDVTIDRTDATATLCAGTTTVAVASWSSFHHDPVEPVGYAEAAEAGPYGGATDHPFPGCFVCGTDRAVGDGLRLFPGRLGPGRTACTWQPSAVVADQTGAAATTSDTDADAVPAAVVWSALDCPGGWSCDLAGRPMVLGTMTAMIERAPGVGERCVVVGRLDEAFARRSTTSTALYGERGELLARAEAVWVQIDPETFNRLSAPA